MNPARLSVCLLASCEPGPQAIPEFDENATLFTVTAIDPDVGESLIELDGANGMSPVTTHIFSMAPDPGMWPDAPLDCLGAGAEAHFAGLPGSGSTVDTWIVRMEDPWVVPSVSDRFMNRLSGGYLWSTDDFENSRNDWVADRTAATAVAGADLISQVSSIANCAVKEVMTVFPYATLECDVAGADALWSAGGVVCLDSDSVGAVVDDNSGTTINDHQLRPFLPQPGTASTASTGLTPGNSSMKVAILEGTVPPSGDRVHNAFQASGLTRRVDLAAKGCDRQGWVTDCRIGWEKVSTLVLAHPMGTATVLLGDVTLDQEPTLPVASTAFSVLEARSGVARGITAEFQSVGYSQGALVGAMQFAAVPSNGISAVNMSASARGTGSIVDCDGTGGRQEAVNIMFESGVPLFKSAGNEDRPGHHDHLACNVGKPGGALGAFTVGALQNPAPGPPPLWARRGDSSHGDPSARRTIVDVAADGSFSPWYDGATPYDMSRAYTGTSAATPVATAAAMVYRDHYESLSGGPRFIRVPEVLHARLLLNADSEAHLTSGGAPTTDDAVTATTPITSGFDARFGAGRLQFRPVFERVGTTSLFARKSRAGTVCVPDDRVVHVPLPEVSGSYTGKVTVVARFHDERHGKDGNLDEMELYVGPYTTSTSGSVVTHLFTALESDVRRQEKMRVSAFVSAVPDLRAAIYGVDVTGENDSCDPGERRVYYAYSWD